MSQETFELIRQMDGKSTQLQIALQCAPFLSGLKVSNLLIIGDEGRKESEMILLENHISYYPLLSVNGRTTFLLYREKELCDYLAAEEAICFLEAQGYKETDLNSILLTISRKYGGYMNGSSDFPHEMGLLLGYPLEDVKGFVENKGENYLMAGYWKVYSNQLEKEKLFQRFEYMKKTMVQMLFYGMNIMEIMELCRSVGEERKENTWRNYM